MITSGRFVPNKSDGCVFNSRRFIVYEITFIIDAGFVICAVLASKGVLISKNSMTTHKLDDKTLLAIAIYHVSLKTCLMRKQYFCRYPENNQ